MLYPTLLWLPLLAAALFVGSVVFWTAFSHLRFLIFHRSEGKKPVPLGIRGWLVFYLRTLRGACLLLWWFFRAAFRGSLRLPPGEHRGRPVLCVHGLFLNSTCMWGIRRALERRGHPTRGVFMGAPIPTPLAYADPLSKVMIEMAGRSAEGGFDVVAHSIGGVMVREVLRRQPELAGRVRQIVTLGSPHHGTAVLRWMRFGAIYRLLRRDSDYLRRLPDFRTLSPRTAVTTIATQHDLVVYPTSTAHLTGAQHITLSGVSHLGLMTEPGVMTLVEKALAASTRAGQAR